MIYKVIFKKKLTKRVYCFAYNIPQSPDLKALGSGIHLLLSLHIKEKSVQINQKLAFVNVSIALIIQYISTLDFF